ncbi:MAG: DNA polymerase I [Bacteroidaceae bacterium]|nr:DNA polymerase I [Bacteroidaceae bacterium]
MTLYLLDAYALIYRAYYGLISSPLINTKGQNVSAAHGFVSTLWDIIQKEQPDYLGVAFDPHGPTFRHEAYAPYKAQREETPEDIRWAVPVVKEILQAMNIPVLEVPGYEADDVIGTLAQQGAEQGMEVYMVTPDKDYGQLVSDHITMLRPGFRGGFDRLGPTEVCDKYGIPHPTQVLDLLALMGDSADNFPGCPGVGEKTAVKLIQQFGSIENMLAHTEDIKGALRRKVEEHVEDIEMSRFLATIKTDVPITLDLDLLRRKEPDTPTLLQIFAEHEFAKLSRRICGIDTKAEPHNLPEAENQTILSDVAVPSVDIIYIDNVNDTDALVANILTMDKVGFALKIDKTDLQEAKITSIGLSDGTKAWELRPADSEESESGFGGLFAQIEEEEDGMLNIVNHLKPLFNSPTLTLVGYDMKPAIEVLMRMGIDVQCQLWDTQLAYYVIDPEAKYGLRDQSVQFTSAQMAAAALSLMPELEAKMEETGVASVFHEIEMPLLPVLARMENNGVRLDSRALAETGRAFQERLSELEGDIYALAGHEFLLTSPRQVGEVLFDELHISDKAKKTKSGQYSTSEEILEALRPQHEIVGKILQHRALKKLQSTYVDALPKLISPRTGRIHTSFNQAVTATGRLSSSNPNLQNIPVRREDGKEIRKCFVPEPGEVFFSADYSQIELRIMAHLSQDEGMIADFKAGHDVHQATAARVFHVEQTEVTADMRRKAKTANFGIIYGISAFGLAERMEVSRGEAKELIDSYFETYPGVRGYIDKAVAEARDKGYALTAFGRRRYLRDISSRNGTVRAFAERNAVNAPIQGTAADIIKVAMIRIDRRLREEHFRAKMILQVHDELNFSCPQDELPRLQEMVLQEMALSYPMSVPLIADSGVGQNWLEAH